VLAAVLGWGGGVVANVLGRSRLVWIVAVGVLVGILAASGPHIFHEWRYPAYGPPGQPPQPLWVIAGAFALFGGLVGLPVGLLFLALGEAANRWLRKAGGGCPTSSPADTGP